MDGWNYSDRLKYKAFHNSRNVTVIIYQLRICFAMFKNNNVGMSQKYWLFWNYARMMQTSSICLKCPIVFFQGTLNLWFSFLWLYVSTSADKRWCHLTLPDLWLQSIANSMSTFTTFLLLKFDWRPLGAPAQLLPSILVNLRPQSHVSELWWLARWKASRHEGVRQ